MARPPFGCRIVPVQDRKSTRLNSSHSQISYAVFCLKKKKIFNINTDRPPEIPFRDTILPIRTLLFFKRGHPAVQDVRAVPELVLIELIDPPPKPQV